MKYLLYISSILLICVIPSPSQVNGQWRPSNPFSSGGGDEATTESPTGTTEESSNWKPSNPFSSWGGGGDATEAPGDPATEIIETEDGTTIITIESTAASSGGGWGSLSSYGSSFKGISGGGGGGEDQCNILSMIGLTPNQLQNQLNQVLNETVAGLLNNLNQTINPLLEQVVGGVRKELNNIKEMTSGLKDDLIYEIHQIKNETLGLVKDVVGDALELVENLRDQLLQTVENTIESLSNILDKLKYQVVDIVRGLLDMVKKIANEIRDELLQDSNLLDDIGKITADIGKLIHTTISNIATSENQASMERMLTQLETALKGGSKAQDASIESRDKEEDKAVRTTEKAKKATIGSFDIMGLIATLLSVFSLDSDFIISRLGFLLYPIRVIFDPQLIAPVVIAVCDFVINTIDRNEDFLKYHVQEMTKLFSKYIQKPGVLPVVINWIKTTFKINLNMNWNHDGGIIG